MHFYIYQWHLSISRIKIPNSINMTRSSYNSHLNLFWDFAIFDRIWNTFSSNQTMVKESIPNQNCPPQAKILRICDCWSNLEHFSGNPATTKNGGGGWDVAPWPPRNYGPGRGCLKCMVYREWWVHSKHEHVQIPGCITEEGCSIQSETGSRSLGVISQGSDSTANQRAVLTYPH